MNEVSKKVMMEEIYNLIGQTLTEQNKGRPFFDEELKEIEDIINSKIFNIDENNLFRVVLKNEKNKELSVLIQTRTKEIKEQTENG